LRSQKKKIDGWYPRITSVGLLCLLALAGVVHKSAQTPATAQQANGATFDFDQYTKNKPFKLNTLPTTAYGPPWADILKQPSNFLECKGAAIALCYYSGPGPTTPCNPEGHGIANCTCYEIPAGHPYLVDINAILNRDVYLQTVAKCGKDGQNCRSTGPLEAPVCAAINNNTLIPGADLISTFSLYLEKEAVTEKESEFSIVPTLCPAASYAGCMTAPCKKTGKIDPTTHLPLVQCGCPTYTGPYQVGTHIHADQCALGGNHVWSAGYSPTPTPGN
jgi:hypothetical protein